MMFTLVADQRSKRSPLYGDRKPTVWILQHIDALSGKALGGVCETITLDFGFSCYTTMLLTAPQPCNQRLMGEGE